MALTRTHGNLLIWIGVTLMFVALLMRIWNTHDAPMENLAIGLVGLTIGIGILTMTIATERIGRKLNEIRDLLREIRDDFSR